MNGDYLPLNRRISGARRDRARRATMRTAAYSLATGNDTDWPRAIAQAIVLWPRLCRRPAFAYANRRQRRLIAREDES